MLWFMASGDGGPDMVEGRANWARTNRMHTRALPIFLSSRKLALIALA